MTTDDDVLKLIRREVGAGVAASAELTRIAQYLRMTLGEVAGACMRLERAGRLRPGPDYRGFIVVQ